MTVTCETCVWFGACGNPSMGMYVCGRYRRKEGS